MLSLCDFAAGRLLEHTSFACDGHADAGAFGLPSAVRVEPDGRVRCELSETLPATGWITRCDQLMEFGRVPLGETESTGLKWALTAGFYALAAILFVVLTGALHVANGR